MRDVHGVVVDGRQIITGCVDGPGGPEYFFRVGLPSEEWEQHKAMMRKIAAE